MKAKPWRFDVLEWLKIKWLSSEFSAERTSVNAVISKCLNG